MSTLDAAEQAIADALRSASKEINGGRAVPPQSPRMRNGPSPVSAVGEENAKRLRDAADNVATAVEEQAAERMAVAESIVEECKALRDKAKMHADNIRSAGEVEAKRSIDVMTKMDDIARRMEEDDQKFGSQEN